MRSSLRRIITLSLCVFSLAARGSSVTQDDDPSAEIGILASFATFTSGAWLASLHNTQADNETFALHVRNLMELPWTLDETSAPFWFEAHLQAEKGWQHGDALLAFAAAYDELASDFRMKSERILSLASLIQSRLPEILLHFARQISRFEDTNHKNAMTFALRLLELAADKMCESRELRNIFDTMACKVLLDEDEAFTTLLNQIPDEITVHLPLWDYDAVATTKQYDFEALEPLDDKTELLRTGLLISAETTQSFINKNIISVSARRLIRTYLLPNPTRFWQDIREHLMVSVLLDITESGVDKLLLRSFPRKRLDTPLAKAIHEKRIYLVFPKAKPLSWRQLGRKLGNYLAEKSYTVSVATVTFPFALKFCQNVLRWPNDETTRMTLAKAIILEVMQDALFKIADGTIRASASAVQTLLSRSQGSDEVPKSSRGLTTGS
ncbi:MAG: hypothetical protein HYW48_08180 [Deltaproteobacteria bacterium]|nr:hypothetical protein [Deltaproteobacteria bacterium]